MEKGASMTRGTKRWRLGALTAVVTIVVGVIGASAGGAARSGADSASASTLIDGTTGTVVNIDPANAGFRIDLLLVGHHRCRLHSCSPCFVWGYHTG